MIYILININDSKLHDMAEKGSELLQKLQNVTRTPLTYDDFVKMTTEIMQGQELKDCQNVLLCEQQLQNSENKTYQPGHRKKTNHNGGDKLLQTETFYLSFVLYQLFQKYNISKLEDNKLKFQVIYLGATGVTESTDEHRILNHVENLMPIKKCKISIRRKEMTPIYITLLFRTYERQFLTTWLVRLEKLSRMSWELISSVKTLPKNNHYLSYCKLSWKMQQKNQYS